MLLIVGNFRCYIIEIERNLLMIFTVIVIDILLIFMVLEGKNI